MPIFELYDFAYTKIFHDFNVIFIILKWEDQEELLSGSLLVGMD